MKISHILPLLSRFLSLKVGNAENVYLSLTPKKRRKCPFLVGCFLGWEGWHKGNKDHLVNWDVVSLSKEK